LKSRAPKAPKTPAARAPKVLIVKLSSLGDVVHAMPAVQDLHRELPAAQIDWVVERAFAPLLTRCQGVSHIIPCDLRRWRKSPLARQTRQEWIAFRQQLQAQTYDAVIDLQGLTKSAMVSWLALTTDKGKRYGMANRTDGSSFEAPTRWVADVAVKLEPHVHAVQRARLLCAAAMGYTVSTPPHFGLQPGRMAITQPAPAGLEDNPFVPRKPCVALVHGSSRADKQWPLSQWIALGQKLNHSGFLVALLHGNTLEKEHSEAIAAQLSDAWVWPILDLQAVTDTLARCAGVIGVDSGLSHIAVALDLPHVQIYNFDTAWRTGPTAFGEESPPRTPQTRQVSVFATPHPSLDAVWQAWESLATPVFCR
jgi:heptosyltransferase-1